MTGFYPMTFSRRIRSMSCTMSCTALLVLLMAFSVASSPAAAQEMIIGEQTIDPGIQLVFEGAPKDDVTPYEQNLAEDKTDIHLEVLTNWSTDPEVTVPEGAQRGGFVAYLHFFATIKNEATGKTEKVALIPHVTLGDAMHYARNVSLPGAATDPYSVTFEVLPPEPTELAFHKSWRDAHGTPLIQPHTFTFESLNFEEMTAATRR